MSFNQFKLIGRKHCSSGFLIIAEGTNGVGKSTFLSALNQKIIDEGHASELTYLPTDLVRKSSLYQKFVVQDIKQEVDFEAFQLLHMADRVQLSQKFILPRIRDGKIILCSRYFYSTFITIKLYQDKIFDWFKILLKRIIQPDLLLILDSPLEVCLQRVKLRDNLDKNSLLRIEKKIAKELELYKIMALENNAIIFDTHKWSLEKIVNESYKIIKRKKCT